MVCSRWNNTPFNEGIPLFARPLLTHRYVLLTLLYMRGPLSVIFRGKWMQIIAKSVHKFSKQRQGCHIHVLCMMKFPTPVWEAFNLLHTFLICSHRFGQSAILRSTLGSRLGFWKTFPKYFPTTELTAGYPAVISFYSAWRSITVFEHPVGMGISIGIQRRHLPLLQCSVIMKALQHSSSKPLPFREARNLKAGKTSCHLRISKSSL